MGRKNFDFCLPTGKAGILIFAFVFIMSLVFVTSNKGKLEEVSTMLGVELESVNLELDEIQDISIVKVALHKAKQAFEVLQRPLIVDDTGLEVLDWCGFPGPLLAHIVKSGGMPLLLSMMQGAKRREAIFKTVIAYHKGDEVITFEGLLEGSIAHEIRGERGFGIDAIFIPKGHNRTYAEMSLEEKNEISHRSKAVIKLKEYFDRNDASRGKASINQHSASS